MHGDEMQQRDELLSHLAQVAGQLNVDELTVLARIASRLLLGQHQYGGLNMASDPRDFRAEWQEELLDACVYGAVVCEQRRTPNG
jgi:hypothetical protein